MTKKRFAYCVCMIVSLLLGSAVFPAVIAGHPGLSALAMLALALVFVDGFLGALPWLVLFGIFADFTAKFPVGMHVVALASTGYFASFLSRRFLVEMRGIGFVWVAVFVFASTAIMFFLSGFGSLMGEGGTREILKSFDIKNFLVSYLWNVIMFIIWYRLIKWMKRYYYF